ncbi:MAG: zinc-binding dehydrogenase [Phycisphaeraceae bacterium]|nr:zinc-binding dehydrogenase [Phycisphaeraceae bacterium]
MEAIQYLKSIPRYLLARYGGSHWPALYTSGFATVKRVDIEPPGLPSPGWIRIRPRLSGICGSDTATITAKGSTYFSPFTSTPFVFGHEVVAQVAEGVAGSPLKRGDRVLLEPPLHCRIREIDPPCGACREGRTHHCINIDRGVISPGIQSGFCRDTGGGWSQEMVAHSSQLTAVPDGLPDELAVLTEPLSCCLHAAKKAVLGRQQTAVVFGCGTMGLLTILATRSLYPDARIVAVAKYEHQKTSAAQLGADRVIAAPASLEDLTAELGGRTYPAELGRPSVLGGGADVFLDCIGSSRSIDDAMRLTRPGGRIIMVGMPSVPEGVDWTAMWHKELHLEGSYTSDRSTFNEALALVAVSAEKLKGFVGARFPLEDYRTAIRTALNAGREGVIKVAFEIRQ